ncbi:MAG: sigma-54 dependent transcriptional regulator [Spirochaetaceae bacterium]|nr:sigma-54 dependent transcriptional regulator [Spirochaetaceae bacterium]
MRILIVDDEENLRKSLSAYVKTEGWESEQASNGLSARKLLEQGTFDALALDLRMPGMDGLELLEWIMNEGPAVPVVMMSAYGDVGDAVSAMKAGASDYLVKPFDPEELIIRLKKAVLGRRILVDPMAFTAEGTKDVPMSLDAAMKPIIALLDKAAPSDATILITGESGTGKEVAAEYVHRDSPRKDGPFIPVNLGGVPEGLVESELFGYEKGAFTGADRRKIGLFESANSGTLFLDEIGEMPAGLQVKILRAIQEKKIQRLGGIGVIPIDVRIIAATNRDLDAEVAQKRFREDLYYRLNVIRVELPPLRERPADIAFLAELFLKRLAARGRTDVKELTPRALKALSDYSFPGNIRELENMVERAVILSNGDSLEPGDFALNTGQDNSSRLNSSYRASGTLREMEEAMIREALLRNEGHRERSAAELGITRKTLLNKMKVYGVDWMND